MNDEASLFADNYEPRTTGSVLRALFPFVECGWLVNSPLARGPLAAARGRLFGWLRRENMRTGSSTRCWSKVAGAMGHSLAFTNLPVQLTEQQ
jgi:hypothetical protein